MTGSCRNQLKSKPNHLMGGLAPMGAISFIAGHLSGLSYRDMRWRACHIESNS